MDVPMYQYGIFNVLTDEEVTFLIKENLDWLTEVCGSYFPDYQADYAQEKVVEINMYREQYRKNSEAEDGPLMIDGYVGRPVHVELRKREVQYSEWEIV